MNIQQFQYVLSVVDHKNFEAAAEKCCITQSTLSTMIGRLENEIGFKIFNRKTKPVSVTAEGEHLINRFRIIMNEMEALSNLIDEVKGEMAGEIRIGVIPTIAPYLLPLFLHQFSEVFPKVKMTIKEMTTAAIRESIRKRELDVGILALPISDKELVEEKLFEEPFLIYDCTGTSATGKRDINGLDYSKLCLLQESHCLRTQVFQLCELTNSHLPEDVNYIIESGSMDSLVRVTKMRKGMTILPYLASIDMSEEEKRKVFEFSDPVPVREVGIVTYPFFAKQKLLKELKRLINQAVSAHLPKVKSTQVLHPI